MRRRARVRFVLIAATVRLLSKRGACSSLSMPAQLISSDKATPKAQEPQRGASQSPSRAKHVSSPV
jgi:hypothetical protein